MEPQKFEAVVQVLSTSLLGLVITGLELQEDDAIEKLYSSELFEALENEKTKLWHYSATKLYELFKTEIETGKLVIPDY